MQGQGQQMAKADEISPILCDTISKIVLCTDGAPNIGENDTQKILNNVCKANNEGKNRICIFGFGIGGNANDNAWVDDFDIRFCIY